jgi:hypothetical protein
MLGSLNNNNNNNTAAEYAEMLILYGVRAQCT